MNAEVIPTGTHAGPCPMAAVTEEGTILYSPAVANVLMGTDVVRSRDGGRTWHTLQTPRSPQYVPPGYEAPRMIGMRPADFLRFSRELAPGATFHPGLWHDHTTGRLFITTTVKGAYADGSGSVVAFSDDDGDTWDHSVAGAGSWDWGKLFTGPPATEESRRVLAANGYPHVVYFSATGPTLIAGPNTMNYKSLDGGRTWARVSDAFGKASEKSLKTGFPQNGVVTSDGAIYRPWAGTPLHYLPGTDKGAIPVNVLASFDEGTTWTNTELPGTRTMMLGATMAVDDGDTLYLVWADSVDGQIRLTLSRDGAKTWAKPVVVAIPNVAWATKPTIAVREPGEVALATWGSPQRRATRGDGWLTRDGRPYDGYITFTPNLFADPHRFESVRVRLGDGPLLPMGESFAASGEYLGAPAFARDGSIWAAFVRNTETQSEGLVARARW